MNKELSPGETLSHYRIVSKIGAGGMGEVYKAHDSRLDREVAIKMLPSEMSSDEDRLRRFEQEAKATSALIHPNILTVFDIGEHAGSPFIVAELLEGEELRQRLDEGARRVLVEGILPEGERETSDVIDAGRKTATVLHLWLAFAIPDFQPTAQTELYETIAASQGVRVKFFPIVNAH